MLTSVYARGYSQLMLLIQDYYKPMSTSNMYLESLVYVYV